MSRGETVCIPAFQWPKLLALVFAGMLFRNKWFVIGAARALLYAAAPFLFEPSRKKARRFAGQLIARGYPQPIQWDRGYSPLPDPPASPYPYLSRLVRENPRLRLEAAAELAVILAPDEASWRHSRLWQAALAEMGFAPHDPATALPALQKAA